MDSKFATIDGMKIHFQTQGIGPTKVLFIHGAVGSTNDFALQMSDKFGLDREQFTLLAFDLPGFGRSELLEDAKADPGWEYFELCARVGAKLMAHLNYKTYSVAGWNDGARVASLLAIRYPSRVDALVLWGFVPVMDPESSQAIGRTRDISIWDPKVREFYSSVYGEQKFSDLWRKYVDFVISTLESSEKFDMRAELCKIKCPTLVLYGNKDPIVSFKEHVKPLEMQIYDSDIIQFQGLAHNIHQAAPNEFNQVLGTFVTSVIGAY